MKICREKTQAECLPVASSPSITITLLLAFKGGSLPLSKYEEAICHSSWTPDSSRLYMDKIDHAQLKDILMAIDVV